MFFLNDGTNVCSTSYSLVTLQLQAQITFATH